MYPHCDFILMLIELLFLASAVRGAAGELEKRASATCTTFAATPTPSGFVCGVMGSEKAPAPIATAIASSLEACRDSCLGNRPSCISFSYGPRQKCVTYTQPIRTSHFEKYNTGATFWNRHCFKKTCGLCPGGQTDCSGSCADTTSDPNNCGGCGQSCGQGASCSNSQCTCPGPGTALCSGPFGACANTTIDDSNCGGCGQSCGQGAICDSSQCTCPGPDTALCSGSFGPCTNTTSDNNNCGGCGQSCGAGASCSNSQCTCPEGSSLCSGPFGPCQDTTSNNDNCGACGKQCQPNFQCENSVCTCAAYGLYNPEFETGSIDPWMFTPYDSNITVIRDTTQEFHDGQRYFARIMPDQQDADYSFMLEQAVSLCPNTEYTLAGQYASMCNSTTCQDELIMCTGDYCFVIGLSGDKSFQYQFPLGDVYNLNFTIRPAGEPTNVSYFDLGEIFLYPSPMQ